jgi:trehalose/maltose hydrolase-like predicted phosphorylase
VAGPRVGVEAGLVEHTPVPPGPAGAVLEDAAARTFEAVLVEWEGTAVDGPDDAAAARTQIEALCAAGIHVVVVSGAPARALDAELGARPDGPGRLHLAGDDGAELLAVEATGPKTVWRADSGEVTAPRAQVARWAARWLAGRGITGGLVLVVGASPALLAEPFPRAMVAAVGVGQRRLSGPAEVRQLLDGQLVRRSKRRVPGIDPDPAWVVPLPDDPALQHASESLGALANGWAGTRGAVEEDGSGTRPLFAVSGVYTGNAESHLVAGPRWTQVDVAPAAPVGRRLLDLRTGVLLRTTSAPWRLRALRFVSMARPHALALRAEAGPDAELAPGRIALGPDEVSPAGDADRQTATVTSPGGGGITVAARDRHEATAGVTVVERIAAWRAASSGTPDVGAAEAELAALAALGFDELLAEHRQAWAERWAGSEVVIEGAPDDQLAARFAVFHLLASAPDDGEVALGARGLTGPAYGGHVFWDTEVYVLPALAALRPSAARALLEYRVRRLPAARATALAEGHAGARFPWESAAAGTDVTPASVRSPRGELIAIRTGEHEEHIVADVAWAANEYARWAGDDPFLRGPGRDLVVDGARWWASRIREDGAGRGHIYGVIGPDEYHEIVDDNAYTNVMARWNLRRGAALLDITDPEAAAEGDRWLAQAESLADGYDVDQGLYEQFEGYWDLEPLLVADIAAPPVAADVLLGAARVQGSQIIKQADVVLLHHLVPEEVVPGSLVANLAFYEPRTAHGSSLSPAIHAALLARAGQPERALELFRLAARLDLDDITGTTPGGLHLATMGGVWQALAYGFLGLRPGHALRIDPCLPADWHALALRFHFRGRVVGVRAEPGRVTVTCDQPVPVRIGAGPAQRCDPPGRTYQLEGGPPCSA